MSTHTTASHPDVHGGEALAIDAHDRTAETLAGNPGGVSAPAIAIVGVVGVILVYVIAVATQAWFYSQGIRSNELDAYATPDAAIQSYHADQRAKLDEHVWNDHEKKRISIPIDQAMDAYATDPGFRTYAGPQAK